MKVLVVVHGFPPAACGGTELYAQAHARTLHRVFGDEVLVLTREHDPSRPEYSVRHETRDGVRIEWINNTFRQVLSFEESYANHHIGRLADAAIGSFAPEAAHIHHLTCLSTTIVDALAARRIPTLMTLHDYWLMCHRGQLLDVHGRLCDGPGTDGCAWCLGPAGAAPAYAFAAASALKMADRLLPSAATQSLRHAAAGAAAIVASDGIADARARQRAAHMRAICGRMTHFLAPSNHIREKFLAFGIAPDRISLAPYGLDANAFEVVQRTQRTGPLRVGFFGSLMPSKAPHLLLDAVTKLPAGTATVDFFGAYAPYHGDGSYERALKERVPRAWVRMHGSIPHERVAAALAALDVVVVPSIWPENSPFVVLESLRAGVPVVASRIGGIPELVEDGRNGVLFEPGNVDELAQILQRLAAGDPTLALKSPDDRCRRAPSIEDDVAAARARLIARTPTRERSRLAAIVLNYRTPDDTWLAVKALLASNRQVDDLIVVNNGTAESAGALSGRLAALSPAVRVLHAGSNRGFSGGMNCGIEAALEHGADRVLLVNSDVIVPPDCIGTLESAIDAHPGAGIAGPAMRARTDPGVIVSLGIAYSSSGRMRHMGFERRAAPGDLASARVVQAVSGCVMLIARDVVRAIGGLEEDFFFSFEDVDFCLRARQAGFTTVLAPAAFVYHEGHRSIGRDTPARLYFAARNHLLLARRTASSRAAFAACVPAIAALNLAHACRARGGSLPARVASVLRGFRDYARGRFGAGTEAGRFTA